MTPFTARILARLQTLASENDCAILRASGHRTPEASSPVRNIIAEDLDAMPGSPKNGMDNPLHKTLCAKDDEENAMPFFGEAVIFPDDPPADAQARQTRTNQLLKAYLESCRYGVRTLIDRDGIHWHIAINQPRDPDFLLTIARLGEYFRAPCIAHLPQNGRPVTLCTDPANPRFGHAKPLRKSLATAFRRAGGSGELREWRESATEIAQQNGAPGKMAVHAICRAIGRELAGMTIRIAPPPHHEEISFDFSEFL